MAVLTRARMALAMVLVAAVVLVAACSVSSPVVRVGSKAFTESVILGDVLALALDHDGLRATHARELGGAQVLWRALVRGEIDAYPEYTGTLLQETLADSGARNLTELRPILAKQGVAMSEPLGFNDTFALGMLESRAQALGIRRVSDLAAHPELVFGVASDFLDREDGWKGLKASYGLPHTQISGMSHDVAYRGLAAGAFDVTDVYTTDAEIPYYRIRVLEDDRHYFPEYQAVVLYRTKLLGQAPRFLAVLQKLEHRIDEDAMRGLNRRAKLDRVPEPEVAQRFLRERFGWDVVAQTDTLAGRVLARTLEHLRLVFISLLLAIFVAIPLGVMAAKLPKVGHAVLAVVGILQTVPSLALLVFMIPLLGVGTAPAVVALFLYSLLPIVRNTHAGLVGIPHDIQESAHAIGLDRWARLRLVELPLAMPSILAGIKTSAVINVGTATLGAFIGAGGYGQPILTGIRRDDVGTILEGAIPAAVLALVVQGIFEAAERGLVPRGLRGRPQG